MKTVLWSVGGLVFMFALFAVDNANNPQQQEMSKARHAIERCYGPVNDDLNSRNERASVRELCRGLEREYQTRFGERP